jgi:hypothetical protein
VHDRGQHRQNQHRQHDRTMQRRKRPEGRGMWRNRFKRQTRLAHRRIILGQKQDSSSLITRAAT